MKKIVSLILAVVMIAALAIVASADTVVVHEQDSWETQNQIEHGLMPNGGSFCGWLNTNTGAFSGVGFWTLDDTLYADGIDYAKKNVAACSQMVKFIEAPEDMALTWTTCAQALTIKEGKAICEVNDDINNLTVFYQRNVVTAGGEMTVRLWPCNPAKLTNQSVIVLYRPVDGEWEVLGNQFGQKDITVELPAGEGAFAVCLGW